MEIQEVSTPEEQEKIQGYDAIIVFGRGIAKDRTGKWRPTPYFEEPSKGQHSGIFKLDVDPKSEESVVGGANANVLATYHLYKKLTGSRETTATCNFCCRKTTVFISKTRRCE